MAIHKLKTWPEQFDAIKEGSKTFEFRKNDRNFEIGDILLLQKFDPTIGTEGVYLCEEILVKVFHILEEGFGLTEGHVIMSIKNPVYYKATSKATYLASILDEPKKEKKKPGPKPTRKFDKPLKNT